MIAGLVDPRLPRAARIPQPHFDLAAVLGDENVFPLRVDALIVLALFASIVVFGARARTVLGLRTSTMATGLVTWARRR